MSPASRRALPPCGAYQRAWHERGEGLERFFKEHFPRGDQYAGLLWVRWRIALSKDAYPGPGVAISHGQAHGHWHVVNPGGLFINLESMWDDYEQSIDSMIKTLAADDARREESLLTVRE